MSTLYTPAAWSIISYIGKATQEITFQYLQMIFFTSFRTLFFFMDFCCWSLQSYKMHTKSVNVLIENHGKQNKTKWETMLCCCYYFLSLISARKLIEFRKVDDFWAICCGPSIIRNHINCSSSTNIEHGQFELNGLWDWFNVAKEKELRWSQ